MRAMPRDPHPNCHQAVEDSTQVEGGEQDFRVVVVWIC